MTEPPRRIVSLVPSWTETVFALDAGEHLVGATRYCEEPADGLRDVARVGGTKNPSREGIAALDPDLVLVNTEENRAEDIAWLRERFEVMEAMPRTVPEAAEFVRALGERLGAGPTAGLTLLEMEAQCARGEVERHVGGPVRVFYAIWNKPWMSINRDTYIHDVLERAGAENLTADRAERYPELAVEGLAGLGADLVILPDEPFPFEAKHRDEVVAAGLFGDSPVLTVSGKDFCWHGVRTGPGLGRVIDLLAPYRRAE